MKPEDKIRTAVDITRRYAGSMCIYLSISHDPPEIMDKIINDMMYESTHGMGNAWFTRSVPAKSEMITKCTNKIADVINYYMFIHDYKVDEAHSGSMNLVTSVCAVVKAGGAIGYTKNIYDHIYKESVKLRAGERIAGKTEFAKAIMNDVIFNSLF